MTAVKPAEELLVIDNDFGGDPDGLVALAHILLRCDPGSTILVTTSPLDPGLAGAAGVDPTTTASRGRHLAEHLVQLLGLKDVRVVPGAETTGTTTGQVSAAARTIVETSARFERTTVLCGGPLTNVAAALRLDLSLADRAALVWVGGTRTEAGRGEYNSDTDAGAAGEVLASGMTLVRIPYEEYTQMTVAVDAVKNELAAASPVGSWLAERLLDVPSFVELGTTLTLGDSVLVPFVPGPSTPGRQTAPGAGTDHQIDSIGSWNDLIRRLVVQG
ncbi:nucleoside hydrolase [Arthrobacter sedimenti]|uniref:nucleoside hydrolase n=1 Tax=Arthrobacter sedimenti TaxID=2694931 RepID=UPI0014242F0F|nr:nucleoside hydrolase [Arthrobacter sedimenti]